MKITVSAGKKKELLVLAVFVILALMFVNCGKEKSEIEKKYSYSISYDEIIIRELAEKKQHYRVFLDFEFGMSQDQVKRKFDSLVYEGKVFPDSTIQVSYLDTNITVSGYMYDFHSDSSVYKSIIHSDYFNDSLYIQTIVIYADYNPSSFEELVAMYKRKYGDYKLQRDDSNTIWVNANREINISKMSGIGISIKYTDIKIRNSKNTGQDNKDEFDMNEKIKKSVITESGI